MRGRGNTVLGEEGEVRGPIKAWGTWLREETDLENLEKNWSEGKIRALRRSY